MFKIGDFSRLSFVTVKTLRYYDKIGLLKPVNADRFTGYRYYSVAQLPQLNYIVTLKKMGLSLEEIAILVNNNLTTHQMRDIFILKKGELRQRVEDDQRKLEQIEELLKQIEKEGKMPDYQISIKKVEPQLIASIRAVLPTYSHLGQLYGELIPYLYSKKGKPTGPTIYICHDSEYKEKDVDLEAAIPIAEAIPSTDRIKVYELPGIEEAVCTIYKGPYEDIGDAYSAIMSWTENNCYQITGPDRELYLTSPADTQDPAEYVTEIQFPVKKV